MDRLRLPASQVRALYRKLAELNLAGRRKVTGIGPRRAEIIVPGVAVLLTFLEEFRVLSVYYSRAGVRDGIIADLAARNVGAELSRLSRDQRREVESMARRYGVSLELARKVADITSACCSPRSSRCIACRRPPASSWTPPPSCTMWGTSSSAASHHKHSYYVVANSDMAGFTERERLLIAALCRYHRRSLPTRAHSAFQSLAPEERRIAMLLLIPILRLADNLVLGHEQRILGVECRLRDGEVAAAGARRRRYRSRTVGRRARRRSLPASLQSRHLGY